jgi:hypothetical protein
VSGSPRLIWRVTARVKKKCPPWFWRAFLYVKLVWMALVITLVITIGDFYPTKSENSGPGVQ